MVGGKMVIELLAGTMRLDRVGIAAVEDDVRQTYTVSLLQKGLTLLRQRIEPRNTRKEKMIAV